MTWGRRKQEGLLAKVNFPPYTLQMLTSRHVLIGGGGGSSRTGVANGFEVFELFHDGTKFIAERNTRCETGPNVVMNSATHNDGRKMWLAAGQESHCQVYNIQANVVSENGASVVGNNNDNVNGDGGVRERRRRNNARVEEIRDQDSSSNAHKKIQLVFKPLDSTQTDFGNAPVQRVVRISPNGKIMATGGTDGCIRLWHFPKVANYHELKGHEKEIDDIDFCPKSKLLATVAKDAKLLIWDVAKGKKLKDLTWSTPENLRCIFKRCRFVKSEEPKRPQQLVTLSNSLPSADKRVRSKIHHGYLQLWNVDSGLIEKLVTYRENLSELAVSDDGRFLAVGTMSSGTVDMFVTFSLQRVLHVPNAHNMFITSLEFLPSEQLDGPPITSNSEAAVLSCSVDNKICIHSVPYRHYVPFWAFLLLVILFISGAFALCSYLGL